MPGRALRKALAEGRTNLHPAPSPHLYPATNAETNSTDAISPVVLLGPANAGSEVVIARPLAQHIAAALGLSAVVLGVYGRISWGMFIGSGDFRAHLGVAQHLYDTGHPSIPHFLFHAVAVALASTRLLPSLILAARVELLFCYLLLAVATYATFWLVFRKTLVGSPLILLVAGLASLVVEPITLDQSYRLGYLWPEPFVIPTSEVLKPFALIFSTTERKCGTEKPMWLTVVPTLPPVGACIGRKNISTFGNLMISSWFVPIFIGVPPSVSM